MSQHRQVTSRAGDKTISTQRVHTQVKESVDGDTVEQIRWRNTSGHRAQTGGRQDFTYHNEGETFEQEGHKEQDEGSFKSYPTHRSGQRDASRR